MELPTELWQNIFQYLSIIDLSHVICTNKFFFNMIEPQKYSIIDSILNSTVCIPHNKATYDSYRYCIDMTTIIFNKHKLNDTVIENLNDVIDFNLLSTSQTLSEVILYKYYNRINIINLICHQTLPADLFVFILETHHATFDNTTWYHICKIQPMNESLIKKYLSNINWHALSQNKQILTFDIISTYSDNLVWQDLTTLGLCEEVILSNLDKLCPICWSNISMTSSLSTNFIRQYFTSLNVMALLTCQTLDEMFIEEILERSSNEEQEFLWNKVATCQSLTKDFISKHVSNLPLHLLVRNSKIKRAALKEVFG